MVDDIAPVRRIVIGESAPGVTTIFSDAPSPDVRRDPARPGFGMTRLWVTEGTPAPVKGVTETLHLKHTIEPPVNGSVCRFVTIPPDASWQGKIDEEKVRAFYTAMGSPGASRYAKDAPHPYMQQTDTLDYVFVLEGAVTLILDTQEVELAEGDSVVQRGTRHAWSNRTSKPCTLVISSHHGSRTAE